MRRRRQTLTTLIAALVLLTALQQVSAVINIPDDTSVGTWDPVNREYTLTQNVHDSIEIVANNLTLNGNGYKVVGTGFGTGLTMSFRWNVTQTESVDLIAIAQKKRAHM